MSLDDDLRFVSDFIVNDYWVAAALRAELF